MANDYFTGDRLFWDDGDFTTLEQKATYAMLWQSVTTDIAGIHSRNDNLDSVRVCIQPKRFKLVLKELQNLGKITVYDNIIWVKSAIWRNLYKGKYSDDQFRSIEKRLKELGTHPVIEEIRGWYINKYSLLLLKDLPHPTPPTTHPGGRNTVTVSVTEAVTVPEAESEPALSGKPDGVIPFDEIVQDLNQVIGKQFKSDSKETQSHIRARWSEGFRLEDFKAVHRNKAAAWLGDLKMSAFLRPVTLYSNKFESYLNDVPTKTLPNHTRNNMQVYQEMMAQIESEKGNENGDQ